MSQPSLTAERLRELYKFDPETGSFFRLTTSRRYKAGQLAGYLNPSLGYVVIRVDGVLYYAHRLAWLYTHGKWPDHSVDHINGDRSDNSIANLRDVSHRTNLENLRKSRNQCGALGVTRSGKRFSAGIHVAGVRKHLGQFDSVEDAHAAYVSAKRRFHVGCTI